MKITFLGTSHGISEPDRFTSANLFEIGDRFYLMDAGAPVLKLMRSVGVDLKKLGGIFITHSHADHYLGLVELVNQIECFNEFAGVKIKIYAPERFPFYEMREFLFGKASREVTDFSVHRGGSRKSDGGEGNRVECEIYKPGVIFDDGCVRVSAIATKHFYDSHSLLIEAEGKRVLYTGDLRPDLSDIPPLVFDTHTDLIITEAAHPLLNEVKITDIVRRFDTDRVVITHICPFRNTPEMIDSLTEAVADLYPLKAVCDMDILEL